MPQVRRGAAAPGVGSIRYHDDGELLGLSAKKELKKIYARWYGFNVSHHPDVWKMMACPTDAEGYYDPTKTWSRREIETWSKTRKGEIEEKLRNA